MGLILVFIYHVRPHENKEEVKRRKWEPEAETAQTKQMGSSNVQHAEDMETNYGKSAGRKRAQRQSAKREKGARGAALMDRVKQGWVEKRGGEGTASGQ